MEVDTYPMLQDRERTRAHQWFEQELEGPVCKTRALLLLTCLLVVVVVVSCMSGSIDRRVYLVGDVHRSIDQISIGRFHLYTTTLHIYWMFI